MKRLAAIAMLAALLLAGCGHTNRPEGVVQRWLTSLNQGSAGRPDAYARPSVSDRILPTWRRCDPGALDVVEVGRGFPIPPGPRGFGLRRPMTAVPYRIELATNADALCNGPVRPAAPLIAWAVVARSGGVWTVVTLASIHLVHELGGPVRPSFPSEGGPAVASASTAVWGAGLLVGLALCGVVALLMRTMPRPAPLSAEPLDAEEARGL